MSRTVIEAGRRLRSVADRLAEDRPIGKRIEIAALALGWPLRRTRAIWYGEALRIDVEEMDALRRLAPDPPPSRRAGEPRRPARKRRRRK